MRKTILIIMCLTCAVLARAQSFTYRYWIDHNEAQAQTFPAGSNAHVEIDISSLPEGLHELHVQATTNGKLSPAATGYFYIAKPRIVSGADVQCFYTIDGKAQGQQTGTLANGTYHFDIDASSIEDGLHNITTMLVAADGTTSQLGNAFFVKTPVGGNRIVTYQYWVNDDTEHATTIEVQGTDNPFESLAMLDVPTQPVRSAEFCFEHRDDTPCVFAVNRLSFRFFDTAQRYAEGRTETYTDYNTPYPITNAETLIDGQDVTKLLPAENEIHWYKVNAKAGETLRIKTDKPCTLQLFAPSDEEVYCVSGSEAQTYQDIVLTESGAYYLALHDVDETGATSITLQNEHIEAIDLYNGNSTVLSVIPNGATKPAEATAANAIMVVEKRLGDDNPLTNAGNVIYLNDNDEYVTKEIALTDAQPFYCPLDATAGEISYHRNFTTTNWQPLYLPYAMEYSEWASIGKVAEVSGVHEYDNNDDGVTDKITIEFHTVSSGSIVPNIPYVIKATAKGEVDFQSEDRLLKATPEEDGTVSCSSARWLYTLTGVYQKTSGLNEIGAYVIGAKGTFGKSSATPLNPFRLYLSISKRKGGYWGTPDRNLLPDEIEIMVDGEVTAINGLEIEIDSQSVNSSYYYDMNGRYTTRPSKGIYIHNGKKVIIK